MGLGIRVRELSRDKDRYRESNSDFRVFQGLHIGRVSLKHFIGI